jgi:hypothetical protein
MTIILHNFAFCINIKFRFGINLFAGECSRTFRPFCFVFLYYFIGIQVLMLIMLDINSGLNNIYVTAVFTFIKSKRIPHLNNFQNTLNSVALAELTSKLTCHQSLV